MKTLAGYEALSGLERLYDDFFDAPSDRVLAVLGRPLTGKRWLLDKVLGKRNINALSLSGFVDVPSFRDMLMGDCPIVFEGMTGSLFGMKKYRDILISAIAGKLDGSCKVFILDDPYTKRVPELDNCLNGVVYDFTLHDLLLWAEDIKHSLAVEKELSVSSIDRILEVYRRCRDNGILSESADLSGSQFSIGGIAQAAADLERNGLTTALFFPPELMTVLAHPIPEIAGDTVKAFGEC